MRVCLNMIVRNESAVIERCLRSARPFVQSWAIADQALLVAARHGEYELFIDADETLDIEAGCIDSGRPAPKR